MNRDLIIGVIISLLIHGGIGFGGDLFKGKVKKKVQADEDEMVLMVQPPPEIEPEEIESDTANDQNQQQETNQFSPPTLVDAPQSVTFDSITQTLQPPPPPNVNINKTMTVPKGPPAAGVGRNMSDVFSVKDLDQPLQDKPNQAQPKYPYDLQRQGVTGYCTVEFLIDKEGNVTEAWAVKSSHREFEQPVIQAAMKWKFRPNKKGGKTVRVKATRTLKFGTSDK